MQVRDNGTASVLFRLRNGENETDTLRDMKDHSLVSYGRPWEETTGQVGTILGLRNGIPDHQPQNYFILQDYNLNQDNIHPYETNQPHEMLPTIYNGNTNLLASAGGATLSYALNDASQLQQRLFDEGRRGSIKDPLSAKFAAAAWLKNPDNPIQGPATDIMRRQLGGNEDDPATTQRKIDAGFFGRNVTFAQEDNQVDPEIQAFMDQNQAPTRSDLKNFQNQFKVPVGRLSGSTASTVSSINSVLSRTRHHRGGTISAFPPPPGAASLSGSYPGYSPRTPSAPPAPSGSSGSAWFIPADSNAGPLSGRGIFGGSGSGSYNWSRNRGATIPQPRASLTGGGSLTVSGQNSKRRRMFNSFTNSPYVSPTQSFIRNSQGVTPLLAPNQWVGATPSGMSSIQSGPSFISSPRSSGSNVRFGSIYNSGVSSFRRSNSNRGQSRLMTIGRKKVSSTSNDPLSSGSQNKIGVDVLNISTRAAGYSNPRRYRNRNSVSRSSGSSRGSRGSGRALSREFSTINDTFSL